MSTKKGRKPNPLTPQEQAYEKLLQFGFDLSCRIPNPPEDMNPNNEEAKRFYRANRVALQLFRAKGRELGLRDENGNWLKIGE